MTKRNNFVLNIFNSILPVLAAFLIGGVIIALYGENPFEAYGIMLQSTLLSGDGFIKTLHFASPLILTGLAIAITFKANIFNMGVEGQMLGGAFFACVLGFTITGLPPVIHITVCLLGGVVMGILLVLVPALLKAYFRVNEMVVTLMLNYAIIEILRVLAQGVFRDPASGYVSTPAVAPSAMFTKIEGTYLTAFFPLVLVVFVIMYFVMTKSRFGYEITAIGQNPVFAETSGMNVRKKIMYMMVISGALAGLAGSGFMLSEKFKYTLDFSGTPGLGWDGMLISLLGRHNPIGIIIAAIFFAALKTGADTISIFSNVPKEIVGIIQGIMILFLAIDFVNGQTGFIKRLLDKMNSRKVKGGVQA